MARADSDHFDRLEHFYDALPRPWARVEEIGNLVLFVRDGQGWPYYARPRRGAPTPSAADLTACRARQRELGLPETFEWVHETTPDLLAVARSAGLDVLLAPLLSLDPQALVPDLPVPGASIRVLDPASPGLHADLAEVATRHEGHVRRFVAGHPGVPMATVPASATDIHDLEGLREVGAALSAG